VEGTEERFGNRKMSDMWEGEKIVAHIEKRKNEGIERKDIGKENMKFGHRYRYSGVSARKECTKLA
jgi:hypothetical protein